MLEGNYENDNGDLENIYCGMKRGTKKHFKRNKKEYKRLSQHIGLIPLVLFLLLMFPSLRVEVMSVEN